MTLLRPAYLLAATAAVLPLLIHLLTRPRLREREFPLLFLIASQGRSKRFFRLPKDRVLLALRMALVALGAFVLARPSCGTFPATEGTLAIVLDCSASMAARGPDGSAIDKGKGSVVSLLRSLSPRSDVMLVRVPPGDSSPMPPRADALNAVLDETSPLPLGTTTWSLIDAGIAALSDGFPPSGDLWIVSDFRGPAGTPRSPERQLDAVRVHFVAVEGAPHNPHVGQVRLAGVTPVAGSAIRIEAQLRGVEAPLEITLRTPEGEAEGRAVNPAGMHQSVSWLVPVGGGPRTAMLTLPESPLSLDDTVYVSWRPVRRRRVLLVTDKVQPEKWLVARALEPGGGVRPWDVRQIESHLVGPREWGWADAVVWLASTEPPAREPDRGILRFMGEGATYGAGEAGVPFRSEHAPVAFGRVSYSHPVFGAFARTARGRMDSPLFFFHHRPTVPAEQVLAYFVDGSPAVVESGRSITVMAGLSDRETDWPVRGSFLPFMWEALSYISGGPDRLMYMVGEPVRRMVDGVGAVQIVDPAGHRSVLPGEADSTVVFVPARPGLYRVVREHAQVDVIAVNIDPSESDLTPVDSAAIRRRLEHLGARFAGRVGEWWHLVFGGVLVILVWETLLSGPR